MPHRWDNSKSVKQATKVPVFADVETHSGFVSKYIVRAT